MIFMCDACKKAEQAEMDEPPDGWVPCAVASNGWIFFWCGSCASSMKTETVAVDETPNEIFARAGYEKGFKDGRRSVYEELRELATTKINDHEWDKCVAAEAATGKVFRQDNPSNESAKTEGAEQVRSEES